MGPVRSKIRDRRSNMPHLGLGDIAVRAGVGVAYPFGGFNYRRDFELGMGGSGEPVQE